MDKKYLNLLIVFLLTIGMVMCLSTSKNTKKSNNQVAPPEIYENKAAGYENETDISDDFQEGILLKNRWKLTKQNDFKKSIIDVFDIGKGDLRLRLLADTIGTRDNTVKFHGIRTLKPIDFAKGKIISFDLDWNNQTNGCYLSAGIYLSPTLTDTNPRNEPNWIAFEYVGVPPGKNARFQVAKKNKGNFCLIFTEGWPDKQRTGRKIGNQHLRIIIDKKVLRVKENGIEIFSIKDHGLNFAKAYLYLQMSSHSNYPARKIYFDNISVKEKY